MALRSVVCPVHVGREAEVEALRQAAAGVDTEAGRVALIGGEAGVGKSRMVAEAQRLAGERGMRVLTGHCTDGAGNAYAPLVMALRRFTRTLDPAGLAEVFSGPASLTACLLPEAAAALGTEACVPSSPEDLDAAVWHLVRRLGAATPVMLVLEDIHWAGPDILRLVRHLAEEAPTLPLWLVVTYRVDELHRRHPLTPMLAHLRRLPAVDDLVLQPLDRDQQRSMLSALFGGTVVSDEFLDAVRDRTDGNPFFIEELSAVLVERGDIYRSGADWDRRALDEIEMPLTVRETLLARAARLPEEAQRVLRLAAVAGERIDPRVVAVAAGVDGVAVDGVLVAGLDRQLLVERRDAGGPAYAFRHALLCEALADDLVGPERHQAHRHVAEAVEHVHAADLGAVAASLALHWEEAGDRSRAIEARLAAARRAVADGAPRAATEHFERALRALPTDDERRLGLLLEAAAGTWMEHDRAVCVAFAREARLLAQQRGDRSAEARALRWLWQDRWRSGDSEGAMALNAEACALVAGNGDSVEAWCLAAQARGLALSGRRAQEARDLLPRAEAVAQAAGALEALSAIYNTRGLLAADDDEAAHLMEQSIHFARQAGARLTEAAARVNGGYVAVWNGAMDRAVEWLSQGLELEERIAPGQVAYTAAGLAWALAMRGDLDEALAVALPYVESGDIPARMVALTAVTEVELVRGDFAAARAHAEQNWALAERNGEGQRIDPARSHLARARIACDGPEAAEEFVDMVLEGRWLASYPGCHAFVSPDLARSLRLVEDAARLEPFVGAVRRLSSDGRDRHNTAAFALCQAEAAMLAGDWAAARERFATAAEMYAAMPCHQREAEAHLGVAEVALAAGDAAAAQAAARRAAGLAETLCSPHLAAAAQALAARGEVDLVLATVLVTDIVGSTERAAALGDRAWRALLERHHAIVRRELERHRGREVDTAGDGFLAAFESPARGIRCALAVVDALSAAGIEVRAGLHTGECERIGDKLAGIAVHTAARVAATAAAGEVLVSATVRDLVAGSGLGFDDRGDHDLKGVPGTWRLYRVAPLAAVR